MKEIVVFLFFLLVVMLSAREELTDVEVQLLLKTYLQKFDKEISVLESRKVQTENYLQQLRADFGNGTLSESQTLTTIQVKKYINDIEDKILEKYEEKKIAAEKFLSNT